MSAGSELSRGTGPSGTSARTVTEVVVLDLGGVLIDWDPRAAVAAGVGAEEADRLFAAEDFDFFAWNHAQDAGRRFADAEAEVARTHPRWAGAVSSYFPHYASSLRGQDDATVAVLGEVVGAGVPVFGLTNWSAETFHHARERFGFLSWFTDIVVSGAEGVAKPDAAIFRILLQRTGTAPERTFFTDDGAANVDGARRAGLDAVLFTGAQGLRAELAGRGLLPPRS